MSQILLCMLLFAALLHAHPPKNFQEAKRRLKDVFLDLGEKYMKTFYCQVPFDIIRGKYILHKSPNYTPRNPLTKKGKPNQRATRVEIEHIMPAENFGRHLPCWKKGGRKACQKDPKFRSMESDLHILFPSVGEINGDRSNFRYSEAPKGLEFSQYGNCKVYTNFKERRFYPADYSKGYIARSYLYMSKKYNIPLSKQERALIEAWNKLYPMGELEEEIREEIEDEMGEEFVY
ncbi:endonuclease [Helicobacter pametensis]|uniref:endonuclease n=1 Tax=Helicobacter pametensis TaxID=95149 RepID=UPI000486E719|nr:endonuclease [Helicobacter pametensis]